MLRSFLLRVTMTLSATAAICLLLITATLYIQNLHERAIFTLSLMGIVLLWFFINVVVVRKIDAEVSAELARFLFPGSGILAIALSGSLALYMDSLIPGDEGKQHWMLLFVGLGVAFFYGVRCFDIKWLRSEIEIKALEERDRRPARD
jgi:ABC-type enterochelin transport system permease subunit